MTLTFWIFQGGAQMVSFGGHTYANGQQATNVAAGCGQSYQISAATVLSYPFWGWTTDTNGYFIATGKSYSHSSTDSFVMGSYGGSIILVKIDNPNNWGGYSAWNGAGGFSTVQAQIRIPTYVTYYSYNFGYSYDAVAFWVGIGGVFGTRNLWQAGVEMLVDGFPSDVSVFPVYDYCDANGCVPEQRPWKLNAAPGDLIFMQVTFDGINDFCVIVDYGQSNTGNPLWIVNPSSNPPCRVNGLTPDTTTAEWIAEIPGGYAAPNIGAVTWTNLQTNYGYWVYPLLNMEAAQPYNHCPQQLAASDMTGQFSVTYSNLGTC